MADPYPLLLKISLALALLGGFGLGLVLLLSFTLRVPLYANTGALIQVHGQVQALGFIALLIIAVGSRLLPRFHGTRLADGSLVTIGGITLAAGVALRGLVQPLATSLVRDAAVLASGVLILGGTLLALVAFGRTIRRGRPRERREPIVLPLTMAGSLLGALLLNLAASVGLATSDGLVPPPLDNAIVHFELWGFATTMVLAIGRHTWPNLLLLRPMRQEAVMPALVCWAVGSLGVPLAWLLFADAPAVRALAALAQLAGAVLYAYSLRLFEPPARPSTIPAVTDPGRAWIRVAFAFLLVAAAANVLLAVSSTFHTLAAFVNASAARHALAQGFLLPVIVFMAARILPGYSASMVQHPGRLAILIWSLFAAALLRAGAEMVGGYGAGWNLAVAAGGTLGTVAFTVFAVGLWRATPIPSPGSGARAVTS